MELCKTSGPSIFIDNFGMKGNTPYTSQFKLKFGITNNLTYNATTTALVSV